MISTKQKFKQSKILRKQDVFELLRDYRIEVSRGFFSGTASPWVKP